MERLIFNEWTVSGEVTYIKILDDTNEFAVSVRIKGSARRKGNDSAQMMEFGCLMEQETYEEALRKGFDKFKYVTISGHIESWVKRVDASPKIRFVCDDILEVCNNGR